MADTPWPTAHGAPSRRLRSNRARDGAWEALVLAHTAVLLIGTSWWFGGQSPGARDALLAWGTLGVLLLFLARGLQPTHHLATRPRHPLRDLWPLILFNALVLISCLNPSTRVILWDGEEMFVHIDPRWPWLPSSARPALSLRELWQFNGIVLSCYSACLVLQSRALLRRLLAIMAGNALLLAVFGTFQKLLASPGLYFGLVPSPQPYFFSTFVYHNHWGAFTVLCLGACLALLFHALRRGGHRDFWHSPVPLGGVAIAFIAATLPLSASRSSSALVLLFLLTALVLFLGHIVRSRRAHHESAVLPVCGIVLAVLIAAGGSFYLAKDVIATRTELTGRQLAHIRTEDTLNSRITLYRDTWEMASRKPAFGWGLETYADVFRVFNTQRSPDRIPGAPYYREAHNDWLQSLAEVGFAGTGLLVLLGLMPFLGLFRQRVESRVPRLLIAGCVLVLLYAWVEFPFANPAVMIAFWLCLYIAAGYARLEVQAGREANGSTPPLPSP